jgi:hypothetical protein
VPPVRNLWYSESDIIASCWAADLKKGDLEQLYNRKRAMSLKDLESVWIRFQANPGFGY